MFLLKFLTIVLTLEDDLSCNGRPCRKTCDQRGYFALQSFYFRRLSSLVAVVHTARRMAPAKSSVVTLLRKAFIFAGCPILWRQFTPQDTWPSYPILTVFVLSGLLALMKCR